MADDDRKYSSLYSAIHNIGRRPKRASSRTLQESSATQRKSASTPNDSYPIRARESNAVPAPPSTQQKARFSTLSPLDSIDGSHQGNVSALGEGSPAAMFPREESVSVHRESQVPATLSTSSPVGSNRGSLRRSTPGLNENYPMSPSTTEVYLSRKESQIPLRQGGGESHLIVPGFEDNSVGEAHFLPFTDQAQFAGSPVFGASRGSSASRESKVLKRASEQQARFSIPPSPLTASRGSELIGTYDGAVRGESKVKAPGDDEDQEVREPYSPPSTEQARFFTSPSFDANRGSLARRESQMPFFASTQQERPSILPSTVKFARGSEMLGAYDGQGPRESQMMMYAGADTEVGAYAHPSTNSSNSLGGRDSHLMNPEQVILPARMSSARSSRKGSSLNAESSGSPPRVTFSLPENSAAKNPRASLPDSNVSQEPPAGGYNITVSKRLSSENAKKSVSMVDRHESFLKVPSVLEPEDEAILHDGQGLQAIDSGPPSSQMGAERSPRASSLLRIPQIMDNEPELYVNANQGSRASSSFANQETYEPKVDFEKFPAANMTGARDEGEHMGNRSLQGAESMGLPQHNQSDIEGTGRQSLRTSEQVPRFTLQSSRAVSPSRKFSQASRSSSASLATGVEDGVNQGLKTSYMHFNPARVSGSEFVHNAPELESKQAVLPSNRFSQVSRPSFYPLFTDSSNEAIQAHRNSDVPMDIMQTSLPESFGSIQDQVESPKQKFSQVSRPSSFPPFDNGNDSIEGPRKSLYPMRTSLSESFQHSPGVDMQKPVGRSSRNLSQVLPFDSENVVIQGPRKSYMALDPMQTPLPESLQYASGRESLQEQVVSPDQKYSQVSRPSFFIPHFNIGDEANQGPRTSDMHSGFMRTSLAESSQGAPGIETLQEQVVSPLQKFSQDSRLSSVPLGIDSENDFGQSRRATYVPADTMETSLLEFYQNAPPLERMQDEVVSPQQKDSQALTQSSFFPPIGSGYEAIEGPQTSYMPSDFKRTAFPESYQNVLGMDGQEMASPSRTVSRKSFAPFLIGSMSQGPSASDILLDPTQASLRESFQYTPGMENMQEQVASPSQQVSQVFRPSAFTPSTGENNANQAPKTSFISLNPMRASFTGSLQTASGMESEEQVSPASRKSSQALQIDLVPSLIGREEENDQGLRTSYRPLDSMRTSSPGSFQSAPDVQEQLASPSRKLRQVPVFSSIPGENDVSQVLRPSNMLLDPGRTSIPDFPIPGQLPQRPSSLSFSKQMQKRSSLGFPSIPGEPGANSLADTGNSMSDSSSDEVLQERRLSLESVSRSSFSAKLNEQQSMVRPWDMERLSDAERRMREVTFGNSGTESDYTFKDSNETELMGSVNASADNKKFVTSLEDEPGCFTKGIDQRPYDSVDGVEPYGSLEQEDEDEERTRGNGFYATNPQDSENMRSFSSKGGHKSLVQEFIYPASSPRQSFQENMSPSAVPGESLHQEASYQSTSPRRSISPRQSISPRLSARQSLGGSSIKDLTELQTQEFMYSPSLAARTTTELSLDGQDQAMLQSTAPEMADVEYADQELSLPSSRQSFQQALLEEDNNQELPFEDPQVLFEEDKTQELLYEDPQVLFEEDNNQESPYEDATYPEDSLVDKGNDQEEVQDFDENELNDEECFDDSLAETQHDDAWDVSSVGKEDYIDDNLSPPTKDNLHSGSFANLEQPLVSFKRAFGSSNSFVKVPFGASELSFEGFAKVQFMEPTGGLWPIVWKSVAMQDLIRFSKDPITQPLLQRLAAAPHKQCAITSFAHLLAYMGDAATHQDLVYHVQQVLMLGIKYSEFRDEIFCQICKQTTANPSRWSNGRGWQAMALCVGTFGPSSTFRPFLEAHLQQVANHFVGQWAGETMSYQDEGMSNPSKAAEYCIARLQKLLQAGPRRLPPLHAEINAVEKMETIRVNIYLPDDTFKVLDLDPMATAEEVTTQLVQMTDLSDPEYYGIFQVLYGDVTVEKALTKNTYIMEVLSDWNKASILPLEKDLRLIAKAKFLFEKHVLCLPSTNMGLYDEQYEEDDRFSVEMDPSKTEMLFKRRLYIEDLSNCSSEVQSAVQNFDYVQAVRDVAYGIYPVEEHDAVMLGSLQLRADSSFFENLEEALTDDVIRKFGPKIYVEGSEREWKSALLRTAAALPPEEDMSICINDYIDFLRSRCTLYGSCWFYVKQKADPRLPYEMFVAINTAGVYFVQVKTKEQLLHMQFTEICSWGYSNISFSLVTGNM
ncbi:hypothetical protein GOP47_0006504 [Adiantum capillus-veneris]|uniref:Uncharacterized protein n=1 Tax=Adiantum capillus-veneris TaxID=13818 RepID=A0A9D4ZKC6_ADICA|nr:hypothetical protein GOP47_0006504 [Adiantum capillus-veneris]